MRCDAGGAVAVVPASAERSVFACGYREKQKLLLFGQRQAESCTHTHTSSEAAATTTSTHSITL